MFICSCKCRKQIYKYTYMIVHTGGSFSPLIFLPTSLTSGAIASIHYTRSNIHIYSPDHHICHLFNRLLGSLFTVQSPITNRDSPFPCRVIKGKRQKTKDNHNHGHVTCPGAGPSGKVYVGYRPRGVQKKRKTAT